MKKRVVWVKCEGDAWCPFQNVNLDNVTTSGVYVIWTVGNDGKIVYVGQGDVADRLRDHRNTPEITRNGKMNVTWAAVPSHERDGVERYLADEYSPLEGAHHPRAVPIAVNLPGE
mgnify:CR=1 FL=1